MKKQILILSGFAIFLFPNCKNIIGPSLPDEIQGTWKDTYSSYYYHVSGNTLYLVRDNESRNLSDQWWNDDDVVKNTLTKQ